MAKMSSVVYDPPGPGFPFIAVLFDPKGEVVVARTVPSREAGEALIIQVLNEAAAEAGL